MQTAGDLVAGVLAAELAAGVQHSVNDGDSRDAQLGLDIDRDAAAIVRYFDDVAGLDGDFDVGAVARQRLVDGVIDDLIDEVVQTGRPGGADIHTGALAHSLQAFQDLDLRTAVGMVGSRLAVGFGDDFFCHEMIASCCGWVSLILQCRGRACPALRLALLPFYRAVLFMLRAGHARPLRSWFFKILIFPPAFSMLRGIIG